LSRWRWADQVPGRWTGFFLAKARRKTRR